MLPSAGSRFLLVLRDSRAARRCRRQRHADRRPGARFEADSVLVADGNVEVLHKGTRLRAERVTFDSKTDRLSIEGPLVLTDEAGTRDSRRSGRSVVRSAATAS